MSGAGPPLLPDAARYFHARHRDRALDRARQIARCDHAVPFHVGDHVQWCSRCGALRYRLDRPGGELAKLEWFRPSGVCLLDDDLGRHALSLYADRCLWHLVRTGAQPGRTLADRFGIGALLELVFRDLIEFDANDLVSVKPMALEGL
jgi:hypothetical protein